jgi:polynucleotide 5'-kinase involved in rRNA processing
MVMVMRMNTYSERTLRSHWQILAPRSDVRSFQAPPLWVRAAEDIAYYPGGSGPPVVLVCGGKDVGKSSFLRYLVNSLLRR